MVIRFNWFMYSVVIGFLRKEDPVAGVLRGNDLGAPGSGGPGEWGCRNPEECGSSYPGENRWKRQAARECRQPVVIRGKEGGNSKEAKENRWRDDQLFHLSQTVITELKPRIWAAGIRKQDKQDLLLSLLRLLKSYTALTVLRAYPFRIAINNFIEKETAMRCSIHLNNEELLALWREVR
jgi:hypothetical protein